MERRRSGPGVDRLTSSTSSRVENIVQPELDWRSPPPTFTLISGQPLRIAISRWRLRRQERVEVASDTDDDCHALSIALGSRPRRWERYADRQRLYLHELLRCRQGALGAGSASANKSDPKAAQADNRSTGVTATWPGSYLRWIAAGAGGSQRGDRRQLIADDVGRERAGFLVERQRACLAIRPASAIEQPQNGAQDDADDDAGDE